MLMIKHDKSQMNGYFMTETDVILHLTQKYNPFKNNQNLYFSQKKFIPKFDK
jgi:hypothetical protein